MPQTTSSSPARMVIIAVIVLVLGFLAYSFLTMPDRRSTTDRIGDAVHALPNGVGAASEQMEDRTPGQKIGDDIKDAGQKVKDNTSAQ